MARDRKLSTDDRILWGKVARSVRAMPGRMEEFLALEEPAEPARPDPPSAIPADKGNPAGQPPQEPALKSKEHRHHPLERPVKRKLAKGHLAIEARIDLHGMVQGEAHFLLLDFLIRAHARGMRHVLVITGKGSSMGSEGVLKRAVPMWFGKPEFRHLISSHEPAARQHGGEGALYVRLTRPGGERP